jgi:hypothetical protein
MSTGGPGTNRPHVADHLDALAHAGRQHRKPVRFGHRLRAVARVAAATQPRQSHGALAEALEDEGGLAPRSASA